MRPYSIAENINFNKAKAGEGKLVWQKYNCQSCHQLYSLGGYLGPDLTNVISHPGKGELFVKAMIASGTKQMPPLKLSDKELSALLEFLKAADKSGKADLRNFKTDYFGMIESK
jgi:nitric oxide reductase subunit C